MRILVVENSIEIRARIVAAIEHMGKHHKVFEAGSMEKAMDDMTEYAPDLVIADMSHQNRRGLMLLTLLRDGLPNATIVATVNDSGRQVKAKLLEIGANAVFDKALEYGLMLESLQETLSG